MPETVAPVDRADIEFLYAKLLIKTNRRRAHKLLRGIRALWTNEANANQPRFADDLVSLDELLKEK